MMYVPKGFAHGFITLADDTEAFYFVDEFYAPDCRRGIRWNDPRFRLDWPIHPSYCPTRMPTTATSTPTGISRPERAAKA